MGVLNVPDPVGSAEVPAGSFGGDEHLVVLPVFGKALFAGELKGFGEVFALAGGVVCVQRQDHPVIFCVEDCSGAFILLQRGTEGARRQHSADEGSRQELFQS
ncbi:hypothetical protein [Rothia mucilaginosa]|uniref:hypothetical protein n=1 Tax=Rothia mucilaginosa TaxID=43675 RepID=UPI002060A46C|nr:hypothetical protein [Rothia mucilaginosa]UQF83084.1 MAG: hypothetical protein M3I37_00460 [Rothia mucilaginosa]